MPEKDWAAKTANGIGRALWKANVSAGPVQRILRSVSADTLNANVQSAVQPFQRQDGSIYLDNAFRYVVAEAT